MKRKAVSSRVIIVGSSYTVMFGELKWDCEEKERLVYTFMIYPGRGSPDFHKMLHDLTDISRIHYDRNNAHLGFTFLTDKILEVIFENSV